MNHKKGYVIFGIIAALAVFSGIYSVVSHFTESKTTSETEEYDFEDEFDEYFYDDEIENGLGKVFSFNIGKDNAAPLKNFKKPYVSVIYISGVISEENKTYNQKWLLRRIKNARKDQNNYGILLYIDSPGGTVYESDEAYLALMDYKKTTKRPVYAYFGSLAASGGYYIGCSADTIFANRNTLTGSIGVIAGQSLDATGLLDKLGVKVTTITAGRNKNMGNYNSVLTDEQRAILQSIADEAYEQFTQIVADSRKKPLSEIKELADGRVYTANQAKKNGLLDEVCSFEDAKAKIREQLSESAGGTVNFIEQKYHYEENWMSLISGASSFIKNPEASIYELLGNTSAKCLYLYQ